MAILPRQLSCAILPANLYGTTFAGGAYGAGTIFKLAPSGEQTILYSFSDGTDGGFPQDTLIRDQQGNLYGTAGSGGANYNGTVFELMP